MSSSEIPRSVSVNSVTTNPSPILVAGVVVQVGPEGGWSAAEREARLATGALPVSLGPRTLRVETAAVLAVAQVLEATGGLAVSDVAGG